MTDALVETKPFQLTPSEPKPLTPMDLLQVALSKDAAIDVIEKLAALQREERAYNALIDFNDALNRVQDKIKQVAPDLNNPQTSSKYASYEAIDRVIRPIYSREGFSLSFTHADCPKADHVRVIARLALRAHIEHYQIDMPIPIKGPKGNDVMTATHATAAGDSYAKRYLVKDIFNIAIGEGDNDGNGTVDGSWLISQCDEIGRCETLAGLESAFKAAAAVALENKDMNAYVSLKNAKNSRKKELANAKG